MNSRLLMIALLMFIALAISACGVTFGTTVSSTEELGADGINFLEVNVDNGSVLVIAEQTDANVVSVNYQLRNSADIEFSVTRESDRVIVRAKDRSSVFESAVANLTIRLPARIAVDVATGNGPVEVEQMRSSIKVSTGNGTVALTETGGMGTSATVHTGTGRVVVEGHSGAITVATGNRSINVSGHDGRMTATSGNGSIDYSGHLEAASDNRLTTGNGGIVITLTGEVNVSFGLETDNGAVAINAELTSMVQTSRDKVTGLIGAPGSVAERTARTGRGDISLND